MSDREGTSPAADNAKALPICVAAWVLPGLGHFMLKKKWRGLIFLLVVTVMFGLGLYMEGELFRLEPSKLLNFLAGIAEMGVGLPYFVAKMMGLGAGQVEAVTYEYGYTFCIVAGLLNMLIMLDAYDIAVGRKS
jgi:hypothetical protein